MVSTLGTWAIAVGIPLVGFAIFQAGAWQQRRVDRAADTRLPEAHCSEPPAGVRILTDRDHFYDWPVA